MNINTKSIGLIANGLNQNGFLIEYHFYEPGSAYMYIIIEKTGFHIRFTDCTCYIKKAHGTNRIYFPIDVLTVNAVAIKMMCTILEILVKEKEFEHEF